MVARREHSRKQRRLVLEAYGGKCARCGETDPDVLAIDHIDNNGAHERRVLGRNINHRLCVQNFPDGYQILCMNCNQKKEIERVRAALAF